MEVIDALRLTGITYAATTFAWESKQTVSGTRLSHQALGARIQVQ